MDQFNNGSLPKREFNVSELEDNIRIANEYHKIAYAFTASLGIFGNLMVICVIAKSSAMRRAYTNIFILNQSGIDFVTSIFILVSTTTRKPVETNLSGITGELYCRLWLTDLPLWSLLVSSSYTLMALTFERYMSIVHPILHHNAFTMTKTLLLAGVAWMPGFALNLCFTLPTTRVIDGRCYVSAIFVNESWKKVAGVALFVFQYLIPTVCFVSCYSRIFICLRSRVADEAQQSGNAAAVQKARARRNVLKTLVIVVVCYIACNSWNQFTFLAFNFGGHLDYTSNFYHFTVIAMFANCCINPFIYAFQYERYQKELRKLFCKGTEGVATVTPA